MNERTDTEGEDTSGDDDAPLTFIPFGKLKVGQEEQQQSPTPGPSVREDVFVLQSAALQSDALQSEPLQSGPSREPMQTVPQTTSVNMENNELRSADVDEDHDSQDGA